MRKILFSEHNYSTGTPLTLQKAGLEVLIPKEEIPGVHEFDRSSLLALLIEQKPEILVVGLRFKIDKEILDTPNLKAIFSRSTGLDHIDLETAKQKGIEVLSLRGEDLTQVRAVPELTLGMMIMLMRTLETPGEQLEGKYLGIIGYGRIGKMVAQLGIGMGMKVVFHDPNVPKSLDLDALLKHCHVISLHATSDESNRGMIRYEHFKKMEQRPYFLNSARDWLVADLEQALNEELISGAWVDFDMPFKHKNLLTTPHLGGNTWDAHIRTEKIITDKILKWLQS